MIAKCTVKCIVIGIVLMSGSRGDCQIVRFRNELNTAITMQLKSAQSETPTTFELDRGKIAAVNLVSAGPFDVVVIPHQSSRSGPRNSDVVFGKGSVDLKRLAREMNGAPISVKGIFDFLSARK